tara:strand:+ start:48 stop:317 length:270 start_codon:yes stop_codon:yes gene_type:complete
MGEKVFTSRDGNRYLESKVGEKIHKAAQKQKADHYEERATIRENKRVNKESGSNSYAKDNQATIKKLKGVKLTPVSDKDIKILKNTAKD